MESRLKLYVHPEERPDIPCGSVLRVSGKEEPTPPLAIRHVRVINGQSPKKAIEYLTLAYLGGRDALGSEYWHCDHVILLPHRNWPVNL